MGGNELGSMASDGAASIRKILRENKAEEWTEVLEGHGVHSASDLRKVKYADLVQFGITEFEPRKRIFELIKQLNTEHPYDGERRASLHQRMQTLARSSAEFSSKTPEEIKHSMQKDPMHTQELYSHAIRSSYQSANSMHRSPRRSMEAADLQGTDVYGDRMQSNSDVYTGYSDHRLSAEYSTGRRISVIKDGYSPGSIWKRKKEMVDEIMKEAEESIILGESSYPNNDEQEIDEKSYLSIAEPDISAEYPSIASVEDRTGSTSWAEGAKEDSHANSSSLLDKNRIIVVVRKRPIKKDGKRDTVEVSGTEVVLTESKQKIDLTPYMEPHAYSFDRAYGEYASTTDIYRECVQGMVEYALNGGSSTCIAYGQTGSGKTYTMLNEHTGMIFQALNDLLTQRIQLSFYEIYSNCIFDLLDERKKIFAREKDGVVSIMGVKECTVEKMEDATSLIRKGLQCRMTGKTGANSNSSRSHALVRVRTATGIFTFVDLAGSERGTERGSESQHSLIKREGAEINKSLLALKECIRAMDKSATHLPFRHSKLTQVLKESLVGESKCCIIATISPEEASTEHSLNTLRYAHRIRGLGLKGESTGQKTAYQGKSAPQVNPPCAANSKVAETAQPATPIRERVVQPRPSPSRQKMLIQQALASVASRIARERDPETLDILKEALLDIAKYQKSS
ncbi:kinesin family member 2/24 [Nematocida minor]|uniref:kinesin family member 2/24 n=1 Tax=Nematocida minor TaxID=1912983 RepID=UPI00222035EB|nr:kinesin family member 2/24 [Nematocida minor]KAI5190231.1 kinesin family member 2/24 [Nematocida minor]